MTYKVGRERDMGIDSVMKKEDPKTLLSLFGGERIPGECECECAGATVSGFRAAAWSENQGEVCEVRIPLQRVVRCVGVVVTRESGACYRSPRWRECSQRQRT